MKRIICVCLLGLFITICIMPVHCEAVSDSPSNFLDFRFGMTIDEVQEKLQEQYSIASKVATENSHLSLYNDESTILDTSDPYVRFCGYPFLVNFEFTFDGLAAVHLFSEMGMHAFVDNPYVLTETDAYMNRVYAAYAFSDVISLLKNQYAYNTDSEVEVITLGKIDAELEEIRPSRGAIPFSDSMEADVLRILLRDEYLYLIAKFGNVQCYMTQTDTSLSQGLPQCILLISFTKDESSQFLPISLQQTDDLNRAFFGAEPVEPYPACQRQEISPPKETYLSMEPMMYID